MRFSLKNLFSRFGSKSSAVAATLVTGLGQGGALWTPRRYDLYAKATYMTNVIAFRCIDEIAKSVASINWELFKENSDGEQVKIDNHPILPLLRRANPDDSFHFFMLKATAFLVLSGNTFIERVSPDTGPNAGIPKELYVLRPDRMKILVNPNTGAITGYEHTVNGRKVVFETDPITMQADVLHVKGFNPIDDFWGSGPTEPAARQIDTNNEAVKWQKSLLENQGRPGLIFTIKGFLGEKQKEQMIQQLNDKYSGAASAGKNLIVETGGDGVNSSSMGGMDVKPYGFTPTEMDWLESNNALARTIAFAYGVPPQIIGIPGDNTFSNQKEARLAFWETTVFYYTGHMGGELNNWFFDRDSGLFLKPNLNIVPALEARREILWDRAEKATFITINEKRRMVGLEDDPNGDVILIPATMLPLGQELNEDTDEDEKDISVIDVNEEMVI